MPTIEFNEYIEERLDKVYERVDRLERNVCILVVSFLIFAILMLFKLMVLQ